MDVRHWMHSVLLVLSAALLVCVQLRRKALWHLFAHSSWLRVAQLRFTVELASHLVLAWRQQCSLQQLPAPLHCDD